MDSSKCQHGECPETGVGAKNMRGECPYGSQMYAICVNPVCKHPAIICEKGFLGRDGCADFHDNCSKVLWSKVEKQINHNPHVCCPDFHNFMDKMDEMFLNMLAKIKAEQSKYKFWVKTYGYSLQVMKFIKTTSELNFENYKGEYLNPIVEELLSAKRSQLPNVSEGEVLLLGDDIGRTLDRISEIYLKPTIKKDKSSALTHTTELKASLNSRILREMGPINKLFEERIDDLKLLFRASEHRFDIKEFHKHCDGHTNTITIIETEFGKVIGGFTPIAWSSTKKHWAPDKGLKSFIFSLNMGEKFPLNLVQFAIANNPEKGPIFGCCDICIVDKSNKERCNAEFPISYNNGKHVRSPDSCFAFTGHPKGKFLVKQWEVFQVIFE